MKYAYYVEQEPDTLILPARKHEVYQIIHRVWFTTWDAAHAFMDARPDKGWTMHCPPTPLEL